MTILNTVQQQLADSVNKLNTFITGFVGQDLDAAIADANAQSPIDSQGAACWAALKKLAPGNISAGAGIAYAIQRARDFAALQGLINTACGPVIPAFVMEFNQAILLLQQVGPVTMAAAAAANVAGTGAATAAGAAAVAGAAAAPLAPAA